MSVGDTKICETCGKTFSRPARRSFSQWAVARFCSRKCIQLSGPRKRNEDLSPKTRYRRGSAGHRAIMEAHLGRELGRNEHVHHKNHNTLDNRIENLEVRGATEHQLMHHPRIYPTTKECVMCGRRFTPHKTKRKRQQTCGEKECRYALMSQTRKANSAMRMVDSSGM